MDGNSNNFDPKTQIEQPRQANKYANNKIPPLIQEFLVDWHVMRQKWSTPKLAEAFGIHRQTVNDHVNKRKKKEKTK